MSKELSVIFQIQINSFSIKTLPNVENKIEF